MAFFIILSLLFISSIARAAPGGIVGFGNYAMITIPEYVPVFNDVTKAVIWAHTIGYHESLYERLAVKIQNCAIILTLNHNHIRNKKDAEYFLKLLHEYHCYKIIFRIWTDEKKVGAVVFASSMPVNMNSKGGVAK